MSETKHTPGPWKVDDSGPTIRIDNGHGYTVAVLPAEGRLPHSEATVADAALIAAAPDLLEALEGLMEWREEIRADLRLHTSPDELLAKADAALALARGEQ